MTRLHNKLHTLWTAGLAVCILIGFGAYLRQLELGLAVTGLSRSMSWGAYIAQFTFLVGVAASAVALTFPLYVHGYKPFARAAVFGEAMAAAAACMCLLCVVVDLGQPRLMLNLLLHPSPRSLMFWDMLVLTGYLLVNVLLVRKTLATERQGVPAPSQQGVPTPSQQDTEPSAWFRPLLTLAVGLGLSIHVITALLYSGLPDRPYWLTSLLALRFLASAFSSGPAVLLLLLLIARRLTDHDEAAPILPGLRLCIVYALGLGLFLFALELFTALYSSIPALSRSLAVLMASPGTALLFCLPSLMAVLALALLTAPSLCRHPQAILWALCLAVAAAWIDKGPVLMLGGFNPDPFGEPVSYLPTLTEFFVLLGIHATGLLILTTLWRPLFFFRKNSQVASKKTL